MWKLMTRLVSPGGHRGNLSVFFFHRVVPVRDPLSPGEPTANEFDTMMGWVQRQFNVIPLAEAVRRLADGCLPPASAAITFDDGYRDNLEIAAPILTRRELPATLFVATGFIDGGIMFNDVVIEAVRATAMPRLELPEFGIGPLPMDSLEQRRRALSLLLPAIKYLPAESRREAVEGLAKKARVTLPRNLMMTAGQLREFSALGFGIGSHTENHPILAVLPDSEAYIEISRGRDSLERILDQRIGLFAYPNGRWGRDFDQRHIVMAKKCSFDAAFSTDPGVSNISSDILNLPRFTPWDQTASCFHLRMLANCLSISNAQQS